MSISSKAKTLVTSTALFGATALAANDARAEQPMQANQPIQVPAKGVTVEAHGSIGTGSDKQKVEDSVNESGKKAIKTYNPKELLNMDLADRLPQGPDDVPTLSVKLRLPTLSMVFGGIAAKLQNGALRPAQANVGVVIESQNTTAVGTVGLLDNVHRTAFSQFTQYSRPMNLMVDKQFSDKMILTDQVGVHGEGATRIAGPFSASFHGTLSSKVTDRNGDVGYSPLPSEVGGAALNFKWKILSASAGGSLARMSLPDNSGAQYNLTGTLMAGIGDIKSYSLTGILERTRITEDSEAARDHTVLGVLGRAQLFTAWSLHATGARITDNVETSAPATTTTLAGEFGTCIAPHIGKNNEVVIATCGDIGASYAKTPGQESNVFGSARFSTMAKVNF